ncbi:MAG: hypothetical protein NC343_07740, partial [Muribaculum sp.]|nr:hypothetical protein [Muribaculaceae bacterium]MCM1081627.1 hypothetical protein [Muribaculum sp.]
RENHSPGAAPAALKFYDMVPNNYNFNNMILSLFLIALLWKYQILRSRSAELSQNRLHSRYLLANFAFYGEYNKD